VQPFKKPYLRGKNPFLKRSSGLLNFSGPHPKNLKVRAGAPSSSFFGKEKGFLETAPPKKIKGEGL